MPHLFSQFRQHGLPLAAILCLIMAGIMSPGSARADTSTQTPQALSATPKTWALCEAAALRVEASQKLPRALLASVSLAESGRYVRATGKTHSWPWTINSEGRGYYFATKAEAIAKARQLLDQGKRSIDIGCMQVNLRYHPNAFASLEDAFDPLTNVGYAANFLSRLRDRIGDWPKAIGSYHSQSPALNRPYFAKVIRIWENERPRLVRLSHALAAQYASAEEAEENAADPVLDTTSDVADMAPIEDAADLATASIRTEPVQPEMPASRPAPMVIDAGQGGYVREAAVASVGLRLTIADQEFADEKTTHLPPRVLEPVAGKAAKTVMAQADVPGV
ncbi:MAG: transglycosylase SLT domain-containing protein [Rhizobiales bacterium]|nr:transglycosylase SLT domain-containing protein [Hyphomicrobiales bacterium]